MRLKRMYKQFPSYDIKIILGDVNAKLGKGIWTGLAVAICDLHDGSHRLLQCLHSWQCMLY
jgi:hypothetical protein